MNPAPCSAPANSVEPLEGRIAPAIMHIGAIGPIGIENSSDTEYHEDTSGGRGERPDAFDDLNFIDTSNSNDPISLAVDSAATSNTFYVRLDAGDKIQRFTISSSAYVDMLVVKGGSVIAFFTDINNDNEYQPGELTGLSLSANAVIEVNGEVNGDIVTNFNTGGTKTTADDFVDMTGLVGPKQGIKQITLGNNPVHGSILSGGDIRSLIGVGSAENVLAGSAANGKTFDFFTVAGGEGTVNFIAAPGVKGASIFNAEIGALNDFDINNNPIPGVLQAGSGGAGAAGGSLSNIKITGDSDGFSLLAGRGGDADSASGRPNGGAGGNISKVLVAGVVDGTLNSDILIKAGAGGNGLTTGRGGAGGKVIDARVGYEVSGGIIVPSDSLLHDNVRIEGGAGGSGKFGGAGGLVSTVNVRTSTPDEAGGDVELAVLGGVGGDSVSPGGKTGTGGSVRDVLLSNQTTAADTDLLVQGGDGGTVVPAGGASTGAAGGSVTNVRILGSEIQVIGGAGSSGKIGGAGGSLTNVRVLDADIGGDAILAQSILFSAGRGGDGTNGNGGAGGNMVTMTVDSSDILTMLVNPGTGANGGNSIGGKGGKGGSVTKLLLNDIDSVASHFGEFVARGGDGGDGQKGGGDGGSFTTLTISDAKNLNAFMTAGAGGDATLLGVGGRGGSIASVQITTDGVVNGANSIASVVAGNGGSGVGANKAGGKGGDVRKVMLSLDGDPALALNGDAVIAAGNGGDGASGTGAAGSGGSVFESAAFATLGSTTITAGDAGVIGGRPGAGGSLVGSANVPIGLRGTLNLTAIAGDGSFGGAGGSITNLSFGNGDALGSALNATPSGSIIIQAGSGSQGPTAAGKGGSITGVNGGASSGIDQSLQFFAGDGGGDVRTRVTEATPGSAGTHEVQLLEVVNTSAGTFTLSFGGQTTPAIPTRQPGETDSAFADRIEAALNAPGLIGPGGVDVVPGTAANTYRITFAAFNDQALINGQSDYIYSGTGKTAAGGSVSNVTLANGGNQGGLITFEAGDGGHTGVGSTGGAGGSIKTVGINNISTLATVRSFGAGDGGDGLARGGSGGSVQAIQVLGHDIGIRTGKIYGYNEMGGIFAGVGGMGVKAGLAGSVTDVSADSIASIVAGKGAIPQFAEKISNITLNGSNQLLFRNDAFSPSSKFTLSFNGQTTQELPGNATKAQLEAALNALPNIADAGGITVLTFTGDGGYLVQFGSDQKATTDSSLSANDLEIALESLPTVQAKGGVITSDQPDGVHVQYTGGGAEVVIPLGATPTQVASALNSSGLNAFGTFAVTQKVSQGIPGDYTITYHTIAVGDQNQITGIENVPVGVFQKIQGAIDNSATTTSLNGELSLPVTETRSGSDPVNVLETVRGEFGFAATELTQGIASLQQEIQQFNLNPVNNYPGAQFTLTFNSYKTTPISSNGTDQSIATAIDAALEALPSVQALSGASGDKVQVTVSATASRTFNIAFGVDDGDMPIVQGNFLIPETQRINLGTLSSILGSTFTLTFGTSTTAPLDPATLTAATLEAAIENLPDIQNLPATGDQVKVTKSGQTYDVTFNSNGDKTAFSGLTFVPEIQTLNLSSALAVPGGKIRLFFDNPTTFQNEITPLITPGATDALTATAIQTALNDLQSVKDTNGGTGTVQVAAVGGGLFNVTFQAYGEQNAIVATGVVSEVQNLDLSSIINIGNAEFVLTVKNGLPVLETQQYGVYESFSAVETRSGLLSAIEFPVLTTDGTTGAAEKTLLDRDTAITNYGQFLSTNSKIIFNYQNTGSATVFSRVVYGNATATVIRTNLDPIIGGAAPGDATNNINVTNVAATNNILITFANPNTGNVPNITATAYVPETQLLDLTHTVAGAKTILTFNGQDTAPLPNNFQPSDVQAALNALPSIQAYGSVTVGAPDPQGRLPITFDNTFSASPGVTPIDVPFLITGTQEFFEKQTLDTSRIAGTGATYVLEANGQTTPTFNEGTNALTIQTELDNIYNPSTTGDVLVTDVGGGKFEISFDKLRGDQAPIVGVATLGTGMTTRLPINADAATIETALNQVTIGGLTVTGPGLVNGLPKTGTFDIRFNDPLDNPNIGVTTYVHEVQTIDVLDNLDQNGQPLPGGQGKFYLTNGNENTSLLTPPVTIADPFAPTPGEIADLDARALEVQTALNALTSIQNIGGVTVKPSTHTEVINGVSTVIYDNTAFEITFLGDGDQNALSGVQPEVMPMVTVRDGTALVPEQQEIHYFPKYQINPTTYTTANLVGAIYDLDEHNANRFHFVNLDGSVDSFGRPTFTLGDRPIDGIVMARIFDQATVNFTPEARLTASGFFDNDNLL